MSDKTILQAAWKGRITPSTAKVLLAANYSEDQERAPNGQFGSGGGSKVADGLSDKAVRLSTQTYAQKKGSSAAQQIGNDAVRAHQVAIEAHAAARGAAREAGDQEGIADASEAINYHRNEMAKVQRYMTGG